MAINKNKKTVSLATTFLTLAVVVSVFGFTNNSQAEQSGASNESGADSRIKIMYDTLLALGFGDDASGAWGDWGAYLNRAYSAARWEPSGNALAASDVRDGKTFYSDSRTKQTGSYAMPTSCSTQQYHDSYGAPVTQSSNCTSQYVWTVAEPAVDGDDKKDPLTGLVWSKYLRNNGGTVEFASLGGSTWSWDGTTNANSIAVGGKTAKELCSERGNGWRLPTQKELMQAYITGSYFNLTNPSNAFWSATEVSATYAWYVTLFNGTTNLNNKSTGSNYVRCVR